MKIEDLSPEAQNGLRLWAQHQHGNGRLPDFIGSYPSQWAWLCFQLRVADDRPEWFPKGKSATIQVIEQYLYEAAEREKKTNQ